MDAIFDKNFIMNSLVYLFLRLGIGLSMFGHGLVRLPKLNLFSQWMVQFFEKSIISSYLVTPFSYLLPIMEFLIGLFLLLGLFLKQTIIAGAIIMLILIFGSTTIENWEGIPSQMIHLLFFVILLQFYKTDYSIIKK